MEKSAKSEKLLKSGWKFRQGLILSFILVGLISVVGTRLIYFQLKESMSPDTERIELARKNVYDVSQILNTLYQGEAYARSYMQTFDERYYYSYHASLDSISARLGEMRRRQNERGYGLPDNIDTISYLLKRKHRNMERLFSYVGQRSEEQLNVVSRKLVDSIRIEIPLIPEADEDRSGDTVISLRLTENARQGFFKRLAQAFRRETVDTVYYVHQSYPVLDKGQSSVKMIEDSLRQAVSRSISELEDRHRKTMTKVSRQIDAVLELDTELNRQVMAILNQWQQAEVYESIEMLQTKEEYLARMTRTLAWIGAVFFLVIIVSLFFLLREAYRSQRRSRALAASEREKANLLANRDQLMKSIAHDIKSPLGTIIGSTDIIGRSELPESSKKYLAYTKAASSYLLALVNNLLDYVKWQSGKLKSETALFSPLALFTHVQSVYRLHAEVKGLSFRFIVQGRSDCNQADLKQDWFKGDALRIRQITGNLLSNAIKYTSAGFVDLDVAWTDDRLTIRVRDSGNGIAKKDQEQIFEEFARMGNDHAGIEGTGLGLSVTLKWVELLGGKLTLESEAGKGSLFQVVLPLSKVDAAEVEKQALRNREKPVPVAGGTIRNCRVALIDDDMMLQRILSDYLQRIGLEVRSTANPDELISWVAESWPQVVITDLQMPHVSGYEVLEKTRELSPHLPVLLLTGKHFVDLQEEDTKKTSQFSAFLKKPVDFAELLQVIERVLLGTSVEPDACKEKESEALVYDLSDIRIFLGEDKEKLRSFLQDFFETVYDQIEDLKIYAEENDAGRFVALAHKMGSLFGQFKIEPLYRLLRQWEKGGLPPMEAIFNFESAVRSLEEAMKRETE